MVNRTAAALLAVTFLGVQSVPSPARADNQMGYLLLSTQQAANLPRAGGALGMDIGRAQQINDAGMTFDLLRIKGVRMNSPGSQAGFKAGDKIIAVDGQVFQSVAAFAGYVGSLPPGKQISVDYIPAGGGPQQAQRAAVTVGDGGRAVAPAQQDARSQSTGMSTGTKLAIGAGAVALFGCYEMGCFNRSKAQAGNVRQPQPQQQRPYGTQQQ